MTFKIPFTFSDTEVLKRKSKRFLRFTGPNKGKIQDYLKAAGENIDKKSYFSICYRSFLFNLLILAVIFTSVLGVMGVGLFYYYGIGSAFLVAIYILFNQINYPRILASKKKRDIERNLIPVLQDILVQLNSGVPIFKILINISQSDYGDVSLEFKKITKEINSGVPQIEAIEKYGELNTSEYFKRALWQISNGMRAGSDMSIVIQQSIKSLGDEQAIQIQSYGSELNPLVMFYMLIAIILPSLGITFLIIISSILNIQEQIIKIIFFSIFGIVLFMQIMFLGLIKSKRPSLL